MTDEEIEKRATIESRKLHPEDLQARAKCREIMTRRAKWVRERHKGEKLWTKTLEMELLQLL